MQPQITYYLLFPIWATNDTFYSSNNVNFVGFLRVTSILFMISRPWLKYLEYKVHKTEVFSLNIWSSVLSKTYFNLGKNSYIFFFSGSQRTNKVTSNLAVIT